MKAALAALLALTGAAVPMSGQTIPLPTPGDASLKNATSFNLFTGTYILGHRTVPAGTELKVSKEREDGKLRVFAADGTLTALVDDSALDFHPAPPAPAKAKIEGRPPLKTLDGKVYEGASVVSAEPDGLTYSFIGGVVKIPFTELDESIRRRYGYDPKKAEAFVADEQKARQQAQDTLARAQEEQLKKELDGVKAFRKSRGSIGDAPDTSATAEAAAYERNEVAANETFKDRDGFVKGVISDFGTDMFGSPYVILDADASGGVQCVFGKGNAPALAGMSKGQAITVMGTHRGKFFRVQVDNCEVVNTY